MHHQIELTETSERRENSTAVFVEHGGRGSRGDGNRGNAGWGIYMIERGGTDHGDLGQDDDSVHRISSPRETRYRSFEMMKVKCLKYVSRTR